VSIEQRKVEKEGKTSIQTQLMKKWKKRRRVRNKFKERVQTREGGGLWYKWESVQELCGE